MAIAKLNELGFETRYDAPLRHEAEAVKARYLDASVIVKLHVEEPMSQVARDYFYGNPRPFHTTWMCFAEAMSSLKRKWQANELSDQEYLRSTLRLTIAVRGRELEVHDFGQSDPLLQADIERLVTTYQIDRSDALQLLTLVRGRHSAMVE